MPEGVSPKGTREPEDELSARLRALAQLKSTDTALPNADNSAAPGGGGGDGGGEGNYALKDFIRAQILRRWLPDLSIPGARNMPVLVRIRLLKSGVIDDVTIMDQQRFHADKAFRNMALSARDAALLASPIQNFRCELRENPDPDDQAGSQGRVALNRFAGPGRGQQIHQLAANGVAAQMAGFGIAFGLQLLAHGFDAVTSSAFCQSKRALDAGGTIIHKTPLPFAGE